MTIEKLSASAFGAQVDSLVEQMKSIVADIKHQEQAVLQLHNEAAELIEKYLLELQNGAVIRSTTKDGFIHGVYIKANDENWIEGGGSMRYMDPTKVAEALVTFEVEVWDAPVNNPAASEQKLEAGVFSQVEGHR